MREYRFLLARILPYWEQNLRFWRIWKNTSQWKPVFLHILCSAKIQQKQLGKNNQSKYFRKATEIPYKLKLFWYFECFSESEPNEKIKVRLFEFFEHMVFYAHGFNQTVFFKRSLREYQQHSFDLPQFLTAILSLKECCLTDTEEYSSNSETVSCRCSSK